MFSEESLGKINLKLFRNVSVHHEFYRLKASISLEQVNTTDTTEWSKKIRILISKTEMVGCCKLLLYAKGIVMSMRFIFGDD